MISDKKLQEKIKWHPHEGQKEVLSCKDREILIVAGRRWGKSAVSGYIIAKTFLEKMIDIKKVLEKGGIWKSAVKHAECRLCGLKLPQYLNDDGLCELCANPYTPFHDQPKESHLWLATEFQLNRVVKEEEV